MASLLTYSTMLLLLTTDDDVLPTNLSNATFNLNAIKKEEKPIIIGRNVQKIQKLPSQPRKTDRLSSRHSQFPFPPRTSLHSTASTISWLTSPRSSDRRHQQEA
jgi:hypothetical protein